MEWSGRAGSPTFKEVETSKLTSFWNRASMEQNQLTFFPIAQSRSLVERVDAKSLLGLC
jgi:hypothetical protein